MFERFKSKAEEARAEIFRFPDTPAAADFLTAFLIAEGASEAPATAALFAEAPYLTGAARARLAQLPGAGFDVSREQAAQAKFGVSQMDWALADTGTLVQDATAVAQRLVSTLPPVHIALVPTAGLLPDLPSLLSRVDPRQSGYLAFITGPSRTADIERVLTIGVHGPKRLVALFVDDLKARA